MRAQLKLALLILPLAFFAIACPAKKPKYPTCDSDKDCKPGEMCRDKRCVKCAADADCPEGQQCVQGACEPKEGWCSADGDCPQGQVCKDHKCEDCTADNECGEGGRCIEGKCLRKGQCRTDDDCPEDEDCLKGVCTKAQATQASDNMPKCSLQSIYFDFDQAGIMADAKPMLQANLECLSSTPRNVGVIGHTDPRGTDEYNIALSDQRARAVKEYLSRLGVSPERMRVVPKGEAEASGNEEASWAKDRRVEFTWE
ncbi:MAG: OmpA family protein [Deltaproteobacteria bacterium]|nr:OmpA family protein [Deltaproteobacteria bacterium]